jgi:hypothetical protein
MIETARGGVIGVRIAGQGMASVLENLVAP